MDELHSLTIPGFSKTNRDSYGSEIIATLKQVKAKTCSFAGLTD